MSRTRWDSALALWTEEKKRKSIPVPKAKKLSEKMFLAVLQSKGGKENLVYGKKNVGWS